MFLYAEGRSSTASGPYLATMTVSYRGISMGEIYFRTRLIRPVLLQPLPFFILPGQPVISI